MLATTQHTLDFHLPEKLAYSVPSELRALQRDEVSLMVSTMVTNEVFHSQFSRLDRFLKAGDIILFNTSATIPAALDLILPTGQRGRLHLSNYLGKGHWIGELRQLVQGKPKRYTLAQAGDQLRLPGGRNASLLKPYNPGMRHGEHIHLWEMELTLPDNWLNYLAQYGKPIRYDDKNYPIDYYQTTFATEAGSAEMPSAGRGFTPELITRLLAKGIQFAPLLLHTGVSSLEIGEAPYPEYFRVSASTATLVNQARKEGRRIIGVGTTAVRAIESAVNENGVLEANEGWTDRHITPENGLQIVNGLLTGFHEPRASHLQMLEALAGQHHLAVAYQAAIEQGYQWHEFGDLHLII